MIDLTDELHLKNLNQYINDNHDRLALNEALFDIYEGNLLPHLMEKLQRDLPTTWEHTIERAVPINVLKRIVDKLSKIYQEAPRRSVVNGSETDSELLDFYEVYFDANSEFNYNNELFNLFGYSLQQITNDGNRPITRAIPNHLFLPYNSNQIVPTKADVIIMFMGEGPALNDPQGKRRVKIRWAYSDSQFVIFDSDDNLRIDLMEQIGILTTENELGTIPFVYNNRSKSSVMPKPPKDIYQLTMLLPILLTDLNYAAKYQVFSILYGINLDDTGLVLGPNKFWHFKSKPGEENPSIGQIKPVVDIGAVLNLAATELSIWMQTLGIRPGAVGELSESSFASGIAKMIDEADTTDHRDKQTSIYRSFELRFWHLNKLNHNNTLTTVQFASSLISTPFLNVPFTDPATVVTEFTKVIPFTSRGQLASGFIVEIDNGLMSRKEAMRRLNPELSDEKLEELMQEIEEEKKSSFEFVEPVEEDQDDDDEMAEI